MQLSLYLPNFRDKITVEEIDKLTDVAEELKFESIWTLDRIVVPEKSDRGELEKPFGMMSEFPNQLPVSSKGNWLQGLPLIPYLAARTKHVRIGVSIIVTPFRAPTVMAAEIATWDQLSRGRINVGVGAGWMPEEFVAASAGHIFKKRNKHVRETIEVMQGIWANTIFEYDGEFSKFEPCGFGAKPVQKPRPPMYFSGLVNPAISAKRVSKYSLDGWIGIMDTPEEIKRWRGAIQAELAKLGKEEMIDNLEISSMMPFEITKKETDQSPAGKLTPTMVGTANQITENLIKYKEAGMTFPLLWPPFSGTPTSKTVDDLYQLKQEIMPNI